MMPALEHIPHEMFANFIARGNHPVSAAVAAGYPRDPDVAKALLRVEKIADRVAELKPIYDAKFRPRKRRKKD